MEPEEFSGDQPNLSPEDEQEVRDYLNLLTSPRVSSWLRETAFRKPSTLFLTLSSGRIVQTRTLMTGTAISTEMIVSTPVRKFSALRTQETDTGILRRITVITENATDQKEVHTLGGENEGYEMLADIENRLSRIYVMQKETRETLERVDRLEEANSALANDIIRKLVRSHYGDGAVSELKLEP